MNARKLLSVSGALMLSLPMFLPTAASAQTWVNPRYHNNYGWSYGRNIDARQAALLRQLNMGRHSGRLTMSEYNRLYGRYNELAALEARLRMGGLTFHERARLSNALQNLQFRIRNNMYDRQSAGRGRWWY